MSKSLRWALLVSAVAVLGVALVLAFVLSLASTGLVAERHFVWLFWVNVGVAGLLGLVILLALAQLLRRLRRGKFGSRLLAKLAGIFALVAVLPGALIYGVSYQFVARSIDTWFDAQVAGALDAGLALGRGTLDAALADLRAKAQAGAERLADSRPALGPLAVERARAQAAVADAMLLGPNGQVLASAGSSSLALVPERPSPNLLRQARSQRSVAVLEGLDDEPRAGRRPSARVRALALVPNPDIALATGTEERFLMLVQPLPESLVAQALAVQAAYSDYQQRALTRDSLRRMVLGTLTLALVLSVFGALLLAVMLGNQIVRPLLLVADGVRQVADGDLTPKPVFASRDELGGLTRSFAQMTEQLADARAQVQRGVGQLERARTRLQTILDSLSAGVIVLDREGRIDTVNPGATRILRQPLSAWRGKRLDEVPALGDFAAGVWQRSELHRTSPEAGERDHWQDAFELPLAPNPGGSAGLAGPGGDALNLLVRGATLPGEQRLLVFDDITEVVSAQRSVAWAEVARRLAHEIKNPLTPIQLSAERLEHKLASHLAEPDRAMLSRAVATIVAQVQAMKKLVDEFRDYARLPAAKLAPLALNPLVREVLGLYAAAQEQGRLVARLADDLPMIEGDASQLRQVIHNLVQNALDAVAERPDGQVTVSTEAARADDGTLRSVRLRVADNGAGFPDKVLKRAFEPYVTTKTKGTGLGLAVVKKIADEHGARVRIANLQAEQEREREAAADAGDTQAGELEAGNSGQARSGAQVSLSFSRFAPAIPAAIATPMPADARTPNPAPGAASAERPGL
ncbi:MAG: HAMP domain-containing protein [Burkholderiaceae bacterium]|nr:HAMP domain-containing protein [Burkholderiaceae bacterium]